MPLLAGTPGRGEANPRKQMAEIIRASSPDGGLFGPEPAPEPAAAAEPAVAAPPQGSGAGAPEPTPAVHPARGAYAASGPEGLIAQTVRPISVEEMPSRQPAFSAQSIIKNTSSPSQQMLPTIVAG